MTLVEAYAGEIRLFANTFAPRGWALCDGRLVSVDEYPVLFALIGATQPAATLQQTGAAERVKAHVTFLSSDLLEGRDTGSRGHEIAASYVVSQLQATSTHYLADLNSGSFATSLGELRFVHGERQQDTLCLWSNDEANTLCPVQLIKTNREFLI